MTFRLFRGLRALHLTASRNKTLHTCNTVKTPVYLWQRLFKTTCKTEKQNETSVSHSVSLSNANSLLRSMLDSNQNVSCQLSVVKRCLSIVDLIKFCVCLTCTCGKFGVEMQTPNWNTIFVLTSSLARHTNPCLALSTGLHFFRSSYTEPVLLFFTVKGV